MIFAGLPLARRLEAAEAANDADCIATQPGALVEPFAGGLAIFAGASSPLTRAIGLGLAGHVAEAEIDALERFFRSRQAPVNIDLCPMAAGSLLESLSRRGYRPVEFNTVLVRPLAGLEPFPEEPHVTLAGPDDGAVWARTVGLGFFEQPELSPDEMEIGRAIFQMVKGECYLATASTGAPAAGAAVSFHDGVAVLFADSTILAWRRGGMQSALIRRRLTSAAAHGCDLAAASTFPGSGSQRSYERLGFQVAYTKVVLAAD